MKAASAKTLDVQMSASGQHADYLEYLTLREQSLRVKIHADTSYPGQSHAAVHVWRDGWQEVAMILASKVCNKGVSRYTQGISASSQEPVVAGFMRDRDYLVSMATKILFPAQVTA